MDAVRLSSNSRRVVPLRPTNDAITVAVQPCWTVPELAAYLQLSRRTITAWIRQGRLQAHRLSATVTVIEPGEVERFLAAHATGVERD
jgi:excisionase family DNA binding protein